MEEFSLPVVSLIIERNHGDNKEILIQTRWKPEEDPKYSGCIEIPAGKINRYENVYDAVKREVYEETGLKVLKIEPDIKTKIHSPRDDASFAFMPFCCQQQLKDGQPWIGFVFICEVEDKEPKNEGDGTKDIRWIKKSELREIFDKTPHKIFTLQIGVLDFYYSGREK